MSSSLFRNTAFGGGNIIRQPHAPQTHLWLHVHFVPIDQQSTETTVPATAFAELTFFSGNQNRNHLSHTSFSSTYSFPKSQFTGGFLKTSPCGYGHRQWPHEATGGALSRSSDGGVGGAVQTLGQDERPVTKRSD